MKERGILFSAPMVRALLDGSKTQTRRVLSRQPNDPDEALNIQVGTYHPIVVDRYGDEQPGPERFGVSAGDVWTLPCPYGQPGDRLWVREAWRTSKVADVLKPSQLVGGHCSPIWYESQDEVPFHPSGFGRLRPSMFMPRWASRITLEITGVRVERLQDISEADAIAEGVQAGQLFKIQVGHDRWARRAYRDLWDAINGDGSWDANPWVWVVEFKKIQTQGGDTP